MDVTARSVLIAAAALLSLSCAAQEDVLARVGDTAIKDEVFQRYLSAAVGEAWEVVDDRVASRLLDQFLDQEVVAEAARARATTVVPVEPSRRSAAVRRLLGSLCSEPGELPEDLLESEVARRLESTLPARAHVRQLLVADLEKADMARQLLIEGKDFLAISQQLSIAANAQSGGELGMIVQGTLPEEMDEVIFALEVGELSEPVEGKAGLHLFQVLEIVQEGRPSREQVEPLVRRELGEAHARDHMEGCVARLSHEVGVRIFPDHLWFAYQGKYMEDENEAD